MTVFKVEGVRARRNPVRVREATCCVRRKCSGRFLRCSSATRRAGTLLAARCSSAAFSSLQPLGDESRLCNSQSFAGCSIGAVPGSPKQPVTKMKLHSLRCNISNRLLPRRLRSPAPLSSPPTLPHTYTSTPCFPPLLHRTRTRQQQHFLI